MAEIEPAGVGSRSDGQRKELNVPVVAIGQRLDAYLASEMPAHVSRSRVKAMIKQGHVTLNGETFEEPNYRVKEGDCLALVVPEPKEAAPEPEDIPLDVLYEDDALIVLNKPAGMVVHPAVGNWSGTLVNALLHHCKGSLAGIGGVRRPGIVHRLDKDTSGVMVAAKTEQAHMGLSEQFADHGKTGAMARAYQAVVWGVPNPVKGRIDMPLGRASNNRLKRAVVREDAPDAKHAATRYVVEERLGAQGNEETMASLVRCELETGRTHQIRVHMAEIGHPLIGDQLYGLSHQSKTRMLGDTGQKAVKKLGRQALHAVMLGFEHPVSNTLMTFEAPLPDDMQTLLDALRRNQP